MRDMIDHPHRRGLLVPGAWSEPVTDGFRPVC